MTTSVKRRGPRVGPTHRVYVTLTLSIVEALRTEGEKRGYSVSALAQLLIERAMGAGLLYAETPSSKEKDLAKLYQKERLVQLHEELHQEAVKTIKLKGEITKVLEDQLDTRNKQYAQLIQVLENHTQIITEQASSIETLQNALRELDGPFVVRDVPIETP